MTSLYELKTMKRSEKREWERQHSTLIRTRENATYEECRRASCESIAFGMTNLETLKPGDVLEVPKGEPFHLIGRVDTSKGNNNPERYFQAYRERTFVSYTNIYRENVSHYKGNAFFVYNLCPEDIVHVFPVDSDTQTRAKKEGDLTILPSLWLTLDELEERSLEFKTYSQITAKTKRKGRIVRPVAVVDFGENSDTIQKVAYDFQIGIVRVHPDDNAVDYREDLLSDYFSLKSVSEKIEKRYGFSMMPLYYAN